MPKKKKTRKPYRPPVEVAPAVAAKREADQASAYIKMTGPYAVAMSWKDRVKTARDAGIKNGGEQSA